jgi:hypothetical protein
LPLALFLRSHYIGAHGFLTALRSANLRVGLINAGEGPLYASVLEFALAAIIFDSRFCRFDSCHGLCDLRRVVIILERNQKVPLLNLLVI